MFVYYWDLVMIPAIKSEGADIDKQMIYKFHEDAIRVKDEVYIVRKAI
jgi:hypothetical protein